MASVFASRRSTFGTRRIVKWIVKWNACFTMGSVFDGRRSTFGTRGIVKWNACYTMGFVFASRRNIFGARGIVKSNARITMRATSLPMKNQARNQLRLANTQK